MGPMLLCCILPVVVVLVVVEHAVCFLFSIFVWHMALSNWHTDGSPGALFRGVQQDSGTPWLGHDTTRSQDWLRTNDAGGRWGS